MGSLLRAGTSATLFGFQVVPGNFMTRMTALLAAIILHLHQSGAG